MLIDPTFFNKFSVQHIATILHYTNIMLETVYIVNTLLVRNEVGHTEKDQISVMFSNQAHHGER